MVGQCQQGLCVLRANNHLLNAKNFLISETNSVTSLPRSRYTVLLHYKGNDCLRFVPPTEGPDERLITGCVFEEGVLFECYLLVHNMFVMLRASIVFMDVAVLHFFDDEYYNTLILEYQVTIPFLFKCFLLRCSHSKSEINVQVFCSSSDIYFSVGQKEDYSAVYSLFSNKKRIIVICVKLLVSLRDAV